MVVLYDCRAPVFVWITHLIQFFGCMSGVYIISHVHVTCRVDCLICISWALYQHRQMIREKWKWHMCSHMPHLGEKLN